MIEDLSTIENSNQVWFADDAGSAGKILASRKWWDRLSSIGLLLGYFPNAEKTWLVETASS